MPKVSEILLGGLLQIELPEFGNFSARVQNVEGNTVWTQYYLNNYLNQIDYYGRIIHVKCYYEKNYYVFDAITEKNEILDDLLMCKLTITSELEKVQRRNSCRVQVLFDAKYKVKGTEDEFEATKGVDISEAGMAIKVNRIIPRDVVLEVKFELDGKLYEMEALVVRSMTKSTKGSEVKKIGLKFLSPDNMLIRELRRYIFKQQIKGRV